MSNQTPKAFIASITSTTELTSIYSAVEKLGIAPQDTTIGGEFIQWATQLHANTVAWIYSIEMFDSINELATQYQTLKAKNIELKSIAEPWFNSHTASGDKTLNEICKLITKFESHRAQCCHPPKSPRCVETDARVKHATQLIDSGRMAITKACEVAGCTVNSYYKYIKQIN